MELKDMKQTKLRFRCTLAALTLFIDKLEVTVKVMIYKAG